MSHKAWNSAAHERQALMRAWTHVQEALRALGEVGRESVEVMTLRTVAFDLEHRIERSYIAGEAEDREWREHDPILGALDAIGERVSGLAGRLRLRPVVRMIERDFLGR